MIKKNIYVSKDKIEKSGEEDPYLPVIKFEMKDENGTDINITSPIGIGKNCQDQISFKGYVKMHSHNAFILLPILEFNGSETH